MKNLIYLKFEKGEKEEVVDSIFSFWERNEYAIVNYLYYANYVLLKRDNRFLDAIKISNFLLPDGIGLQLLYNKNFNETLPNLNGTDLNPLLLVAASKSNKKLAIYGTTDENIQFFEYWIKRNISDTLIYHSCNGFKNLDFSSIRQGSILMVGIGSPNQEMWVKENLHLIKKKKLLVITVGGFFDYYNPSNKRGNFR